MTDTPEPKQTHSTEQHLVQVRRAPKFGVFMGIGAVVGALVLGLGSALVEPGTQVDGTEIDTTPVIGLMIVVGFVVGAALGALVAVILEWTVGRRTRSAEVERTQVAFEEPTTDAAAASEAGSAHQPADTEQKP